MRERPRPPAPGRSAPDASAPGPPPRIRPPHATRVEVPSAFGRLARATAAEIVKLRGLPSVSVTGFATMISSAAISGALAASAPPGSPAIPLAVQGVAFCQAGLIALGVLAVGTEYAGCQIVTTLATIPNRTLLLVGKATAYLIGAAAMAAAAIGAGLAAAWAILAGWGATAVDWGPVWPMVGAAVYLVAMGLLAFAVATLLRSLIAPLVGMSSLVFVVSPLLTGIGQYGHWLPDQAGALLYGQGDGTARTPVAGALVLAGWIAAVMLAAGVRFFRHDA